jgi:hypothetical protein
LNGFEDTAGLKCSFFQEETEKNFKEVTIAI